MISCRRAAALISYDLDAGLSAPARAVLGFHTFVCGDCRRFRAQVGAIDEAVTDYYAATAGDPAARLTEDAKAALRTAVADRLADDR